ncbi:MAG: HU family DNA-binding protein [Candidatus Amulumruptor caecigallinarius]|nr:HU family DNA-binding protein [Candidatus Amulumruptor caecigallinarius]
MDSKTFIRQLTIKTNLSEEKVSRMIDALEDLFADTVVEGDSVAVPSFGNFESKMKVERITTHPASGKKLLVPPKLALIFRPSSIFKQKVNQQS